MMEHELGRALSCAVEAAEGSAPAADPLAALDARRRGREQRRGHLAALAFVVFVLVLQLSPSEALGADHAGPASVAAAAPAPRG